MRCNTRVKKMQGFTLIEIIIGIVALSISMAVITNIIVPTEQQSADQIHQIKAAELGQAMLDEIMGRAFDENSDMAGGRLRCDEDQDNSGVVEADELCSATMANEEGGDREQFDDVDDYNGYSAKVNSTGDDLDAGYDSFAINVAVIYDGLALGLADRRAKRITVTITTPLNTPIEFSAYKANF